ncbi:hypothetical protein ACFVKB_40995 [Rhodococcus sp. NPDC127530]|uniref:hypothetical protein n=1 Tax=unclassified Rhodococcus (in: high G+C Gram-positive bacteria) TaxID=192944 RepID=UPI0022860C54|nr:hypothetical protein [Rhodococcus sp. JS3073]WAM19487.1 hypothetical protein OYT95_44340 [Rhodococcus sp. JS3073]
MRPPPGRLAWEQVVIVCAVPAPRGLAAAANDLTPERLGPAVFADAGDESLELTAPGHGVAARG